MLRSGLTGRTGIWCLLLVAGLGAAPVNIAPDAVTHATEGYNTYEGQLAFLADGLYPGTSDNPGAFVWPSKGNLIFQFEAPRLISGVRLCVGGNAGLYVLVAYRGARLGADGQTDTRDAEEIADAFNDEFQENTWVELTFPPDTRADYLELITESGAEFYEIQILSPGNGPTQVESGTWAAVKRQQL
jgi:hypothetical protein